MTTPDFGEDRFRSLSLSISLQERPSVEGAQGQGSRDVARLKKKLDDLADSEVEDGPQLTAKKQKAPGVTAQQALRKLAQAAEALLETASKFNPIEATQIRQTASEAPIGSACHPPNHERNRPYHSLAHDHPSDRTET